MRKNDFFRKAKALKRGDVVYIRHRQASHSDSTQIFNCILRFDRLVTLQESIVGFRPTSVEQAVFIRQSQALGVMVPVYELPEADWIRVDVNKPAKGKEPEHEALGIHVGKGNINRALIKHGLGAFTDFVDKIQERMPAARAL